MTTIIVEDGSGVAGANSYIAISDANTFFANIGNTDWGNLDPADQQGPFLVQAQYYMAQAFRLRWQGMRHTIAQVLDWPRAWVIQPDAPTGFGSIPYYYLPTVIPQQIKDAQCMLAAKCINGPLAPDIDRVTLSEAVGSIKVTYSPFLAPITTFRDVELLLTPFFNTSGLNTRVVR